MRNRSKVGYRVAVVGNMEGQAGVEPPSPFGATCYHCGAWHPDSTARPCNLVSPRTWPVLDSAGMDTKLLDSILLPLADLYEGGNNNWLPIEPSSPEEAEPLRELIAELCSGAVLLRKPGKGGPYQLTAKGYRHFKERIKFLRTFPNPGSK